MLGPERDRRREAAGLGKPRQTVADRTGRGARIASTRSSAGRGSEKERRPTAVQQTGGHTELSPLVLRRRTRNRQLGLLSTRLIRGEVQGAGGVAAAFTALHAALSMLAATH
jgi:hypothetical protein